MTTLTRSTLRPASNLTLSLLRALDTWRQRQHLRRLDDAALADIGITRADALAEAMRPIWDAPQGRCR